MPKYGTYADAGAIQSTDVLLLKRGTTTFRFLGSEILTPLSGIGVALTDEDGLNILSSQVAAVDDKYIKYDSNLSAIPGASAAGLESEHIAFEIGDGTNVVPTGIAFRWRVPKAMILTGWSLIAKETGSVVIDLYKDTTTPTIADTITASAKPTLSSALLAASTTLTGWTITLAAGDLLFVNVDSATTLTQVTLQLDMEIV